MKYMLLLEGLNTRSTSRPKYRIAHNKTVLVLIGVGN